MRTRRSLRNLAATLVAVSVASAVGVSAASLNGIAVASLGSWSVPGGTGAPTVLTWADFTGANNTNLDGHALIGGGTWIAQNGTWRVTSAEARSSNATRSNLVTAVGSPDASVEATLSPGGNPSAGLVAMSDGASFVWAEFTKTSGGTIQLSMYATGTTTQLARVTGVGNPPTSVMRIDATTNTVEVSWNGVVVLTYALAPSEVALFKSAGHDRFGLMADRDTATRFDDFHIDG